MNAKEKFKALKTLNDYWLECSVDNHRGKPFFYMGAAAVVRLITDAESEVKTVEVFNGIITELEEFVKTEICT